MAKLLILSSDTGEGHNSTARAIFDAAKESNLEVSLRKPLEESGPFNRTLGQLYNAVLRHRPEWMSGYFRIVNRFKPNEADWMYSLQRGFIAKFLRRESPDVLLSTHPMLNHLLQRHIKEEGLPVPCYTLLTDPFPPFWKGWASPWVDRYFAPTPEAAAALTAMGVSESNIEITPLPVRRVFSPQSDSARRALRERLGLQTVTILINGGARGGGPLFDVYRAVRSAAPHAHILMICGHNQKLRQRLSSISDANLQTFAFIDDMHRYVAASDLVLTKPGALSTCEGLACGVPVLLLGGRGLMPQETGMFHAASRDGFALTADTPADVTTIVAAGPARWRETLKRTEAFFSPAAAQHLVERILPHHVHA
jgi:processive 1,2-diacylglycerol beta-glucosyltransferase